MLSLERRRRTSYFSVAMFFGLVWLVTGQNTPGLMLQRLRPVSWIVKF
jgi:hypothetical protein